VPRLGFLLLAFLATLCWSAVASAQSARWLSLEGACEASAEDLERRVHAEVAGSLPATASAKLGIHDVGRGLELTIDLEVDSRALGTKTVVVPSCEEALDAAVLVLAVALGETSRTSTATSASAPPERPLASLLAPEPAVGADVGPPKLGDRQAKPSVASAVLLGGVDASTLPTVTPYVGVAVALLALPVELRAAFRYGLRREEESVENDSTARTSADFGALELSACGGRGAELRFSLCAGGELGLVRVESRQGDVGDSVDRDDSTPRLAGLLTGLVSRSVGAVRLELELAGSAVALGPDDALRAGVRAGAGAGARF
jgi:hypothetical protein